DEAEHGSPVAELELAHQQRRHQRAMANEVSDGRHQRERTSRRTGGEATDRLGSHGRPLSSRRNRPISRNALPVTPRRAPVGAPARRGKWSTGTSTNGCPAARARNSNSVEKNAPSARSGRSTSTSRRNILNAQSTSRNATPNVTRCSWF